MSTVYVISDDGETEAMSRLRCSNEDRDLQRILERNPDLLPGDQIDPEDPRRWLLIKREMPVPDPNTGMNRWSIDFLLCDQDAVPTFVECKRFLDTRARREIVGQTLEYAANGHHYWTTAELQTCASETAASRGSNLEDVLQRLRPSCTDSAEAFFDVVQQNLREGQLRIIFLLEESSMELRSVVDFLNKQMERSEVLIVEARQYTHSGIRVVAPSLFGYTEAARQIKRTVTVTTAKNRRSWNRPSFFLDAREKVGPAHASAMETFYEHCADLGCEISWGTGNRNGSFNVKEPAACARSLLTVFSDGTLVLNFGWINGSEAAERARRQLCHLTRSAGFPVPDDDREFRQLRADEWTGRLGARVLSFTTAEFA